MSEPIADAVCTGDVYEIEELIQQQLGRGVDPMLILNGMMEGLERCGKMFEAGAHFLPDLMMSGDTFKTGMIVLGPSLADTPRTFAGSVLLGTVRGDIHDIGKNLVGFMLESAGFRVIDLGVDVSAPAFVDAVQEHTPDVLGLSALLTTTMLGMREVLEGIESAGLRDRVQVIIGGAPVSRRFAGEIGADAYAPDAAQAVSTIRDLLGG
jgi:5-methyltetrahydrofolate--homocysteine methyltransferase